MQKKLEITLELLKSQKNNLIQIIKDNKNDTIKNNQLIETICILDNKIIEYNNKINKENSTINKNTFNIEENKINNNIGVSSQSFIKSIVNDQNDKKNYKINNIKQDKKNKINKSIKKINLDKTKINDILDTKGKTNISVLSKETNIETIFTYKNETKNNIFFQCSKRLNLIKIIYYFMLLKNVKILNYTMF